MKLKSGLLIPLFVMIFCASTGFAQNAFTLKEAQDYAVKNNVNNINAALDLDRARADKNDIRGIGLPQVNGSFDLRDFIVIPTSLIPGQFFGAPAGTFIPVQFGVRYNATGAVNVSQLLFSSDYLIALQASKGYLELSEKAVKRTEIETRVSVAKAYYGALVNQYRLKSLLLSMEQLKATLDELSQMNKAGFVEEIDVQKLEVNYNNLQVEKDKIERLLGISEVLLKFQMGFEMEKPISLKDSLSLSQIPGEDQLDNSKAAPENRIEFQLLKKSVDMNRLNLKRYQYAYLPTLAGYASFQQVAQRNEFDIFKSGGTWFGTQLIGATLNLPIFDGFQKHYKIQKARIDLMKSENSLKQFGDAARLETSSAQAAYNNALRSFVIQKSNIELAKKVLNTVRIKEREGIAGNLELITAQTTLNQSENNMYDALYNYYIARVDLDKALGNIK